MGGGTGSDTYEETKGLLERLVGRLFGREKEINIDEICMEYLDPSALGGSYADSILITERLKKFKDDMAYLTDEEMYAYLMVNYRFDKKKAREFEKKTRRWRRGQIMGRD